MIVKRFSQKILNTTNTPGFNRRRNYDMDLDRLGRMKTSRELSKTDDIRREQMEMRRELSRGLRWSDLKDD
jgi:hypothetical protein